MSGRHGCCVDGSCSPYTCMELPPGRTCGECAHFDTCVKLLRRAPDSDECDWFPRRFRAPATETGIEAPTP